MIPTLLAALPPALLSAHSGAWAGLLLGYIDPGTASLLFQAAVAALLSVTVAFRQVREKIRSLLGRSPKPAAQEPAAPPEPPAP